MAVLRELPGVEGVKGPGLLPSAEVLQARGRLDVRLAGDVALGVILHQFGVGAERLLEQQVVPEEPGHGQHGVVGLLLGREQVHQEKIGSNRIVMAPGLGQVTGDSMNGRMHELPAENLGALVALNADHVEAGLYLFQLCHSARAGNTVGLQAGALLEVEHVRVAELAKPSTDIELTVRQLGWVAGGVLRVDVNGRDGIGSGFAR